MCRASRRREWKLAIAITRTTMAAQRCFPARSMSAERQPWVLSARVALRTSVCSANDVDERIDNFSPARVREAREIILEANRRHGDNPRCRFGHYILAYMYNKTPIPVIADHILWRNCPAKWADLAFWLTLCDPWRSGDNRGFLCTRRASLGARKTFRIVTRGADTWVSLAVAACKHKWLCLQTSTLACSD
jgi:hypothetical protein